MPDPEPQPEEKPICPECGRDLTGHNPWAHALDHWPEAIPNPTVNKEAVKRQAILRKMAEDRGYL